MHEGSMTDSTESHLEQYRGAISRGRWYAACESGHFFWSGPDRATHKLAAADASSHDEEKHDKEPTAVVLPSD